jgi:hypothetical protein
MQQEDKRCERKLITDWRGLKSPSYLFLLLAVVLISGSMSAWDEEREYLANTWVCLRCERVH